MVNGIVRTTESCKLCEKIVITVEAKRRVDKLFDLPNTFDPISRKYSWKHYDIMSYVLIPRTFQGFTAQVDFYMCIDEDDLDDIHVLDYASEFLRRHIFPNWRNFKEARLTKPVLASPTDIECWKLRHESLEDYV